MENNRTNYWRGIFGGIVGSIVILLLFSLLHFNQSQSGRIANSQENGVTEAESAISLTDFEERLTGVVAETQNAVVSVGNYQQAMNSQNPFGSFGSFESYYRGPGLELDDIQQEPVLAGTGSGVIYRIDGDTAYIVTNNHVIEGHDALQVTLTDGTEVEAREVGSDALSDLAVLAISSEHVSDTIEFANSDETLVGSLAIAIGSPIGETFSTSVTQGIVSGLNRAVPVDTNSDGAVDWEMSLMQTDAAINPGNSGGALVNSSGQLIGISSSKLASSAIEGMGFAIPSNDVKGIIAQLEANGEVVRPVLGTTTVDLSYFTIESRVEQFGLAEDTTEGVVVVEVQAGSSADQAGIQAVDVITAINGESVIDAQGLRQLLYQHQVGDTIKVSVIREGESLELDVTLDSAIENPAN